MKQYFLFLFPMAVSVCLLTGCAAAHPLTDVGLAAGGAALGGSLSHNNGAAIAGGAAGGVLLGEGLHFATKAMNARAYLRGYDKGRSDAVKQQYWLYVSRQRSRNGDDGHVRLYEVHLPQQVIDGVIFKPTTRYLRIED